MQFTHLGNPQLVQLLSSMLCVSLHRSQNHLSFWCIGSLSSLSITIRRLPLIAWFFWWLVNARFQNGFVLIVRKIKKSLLNSFYAFRDRSRRTFRSSFFAAFPSDHERIPFIVNHKLITRVWFDQMYFVYNRIVFEFHIGQFGGNVWLCSSLCNSQTGNLNW